MAEGIVSFILDKLSNAVVKEVLLIHGVGEQVEKLSDELSWIKTFLKDADMKQIVNEMEKLWVKKVRDVAYDIEDAIDNALLLNVSETGNPSKEHQTVSSQIFEFAKTLLGKRKRDPALPNLAVEMNKILARIHEINENRVKYGINTLGEGSGERLRLPIRPPVLHQIDDPDVVGFDSDRENVVNQLLDTSNKRRTVISIVGPGGLGKTTLVRKVYNSEDVKRQFDVRIWVVISQEFSLMDILRKIIEQVEGKPLPQNNLEGGEEYLLTKVYKILNGEKYTVEDYLCPNSHDSQPGKKPQPKKYLLVLDDIWKRDIWTKIGEVLPDAKIGSRVIVTTRIQNVVDNAELYKLSYLTEEVSLELLFKKALPNQDLIEGYPDELNEVGKQFVKKCGGLPLALSVLGGLLSKKNPNYISWSNMLQTMNWSIEGRECTEIMETSYDDLPLVLKTCFMYFAAFPEDYEIEARRLFLLWVAEGFIPTEESRTLENTAESFLEDLVQRSLVQVLKRSHDDSITSCRIHDLLRELAIKKAKEDNFLTICSNPDNRESSAKARRVAVHYSGCDELMKHANPNLRSLLCFKKPMPNCSRQRLLKVLSGMQGSSRDLVDFECFHGLHQLRYCELGGNVSSNRRSFESFISSLKFVETLDFFRLNDHGDLPDDIWNVKTLRHVMLNYLKEYTAAPSSSNDLRNLQTLRAVKSRESWNAQLPKLPNLRDLHIKVESSFSWDVMAKLLDTLNHLTHLVLCGCQVPQTIVEMQRFPFYQYLQYLYLRDLSPSPNKLSPEVGMFPIHITELTLQGIQFKEDPLPVLEKLRSLRVLWLWSEQVNRKMSCSDGGFQQLHQLNFLRLPNLEEWEIEAGAMPILKEVKLWDCKKLRVPLGLQYLSNLKELEVDACSELKEHEDEIRNNICKHVPHISWRY
ncbi:disease resistance protein RPP13-like isoform X1 [Carex rostrata]